MKTNLLTSILLIATCFVAQNISAYDFSAENNDGVTIYYNILDEQDKTCEVTAKEERSTWNESDFYSDYVGAINIPSSANGYQVVKVGYRAFYSCKGVTNVNIPSSVTTIGGHAFQQCLALTYVWMSSVTTIENQAFQRCTGLKSISIPSSVTTIGSYAFNLCSGLTSMTIPKSVTIINGNIFENCPNLLSIKVEEGNPKYNSNNNCNAIIETSTNTLVSGCQNTVIPNTITKIGKSAFRGCYCLTSISIPNSVVTIDSYAFTECTGLTSVTLPNSVTTIGSSSFWNCTNLTSIDIPNSVKTIGSFAFEKCIKLSSITIPNSVTTIQRDAFKNCISLTSITSYITDVFETGITAFIGCYNRATLYVPKGLVSAYQEVGDWKNIANIEEMVEKTSMTLSCTDRGTVVINNNQEFTNDIDEVEINNGAENTFVFKPNANYQLTKVLINGEDVTSSVNNNQLTTMIPAGSKMNVVFSQTTGDVNGDGKVDISDVVKLVNIILGGSSGEEPDTTYQIVPKIIYGKVPASITGFNATDYNNGGCKLSDITTSNIEDAISRGDLIVGTPDIDKVRTSVGAFDYILCLVDTSYTNKSSKLSYFNQYTEYNAGEEGYQDNGTSTFTIDGNTYKAYAQFSVMNDVVYISVKNTSDF